jgi:glycosyltransferase involved in cell wall biosynthesis
MKIWFVSTYDQPKGQSSRTYDYANSLAGLGHEITFFTSSYNHFTQEEKLDPNEDLREEKIGKINVVWLKTIAYEDNGFWRGVNMLHSAWKTFWIGYSKKERPDIVFGPSVPLFTGLAAWFISQSKRSYFCFEIRDIWPQALVDVGVFSKNNPIVWILKKIEVFLYKNTDVIITALPFAYRHICQYGISKDKIFWFSNGINFKRFSGCKNYDGGEKNKLKMMYVGNFSHDHGIKTIIKAVKALKGNKIVNFQVIFVGGGKKKAYYKKIVHSYNLKNIEFHDFVEKKDIPKVQERADVFIVSAKDVEVFKFGINFNKVFDYLASGRPIIFAVNSPNNPVEESGSGISIPPEDPQAMAQAIEKFYYMSPQKRKSLGQNGRKYAEKYYNIDVLAKKLEKILLNLVEEK